MTAEELYFYHYARIHWLEVRMKIALRRIAEQDKANSEAANGLERV